MAQVDSLDIQISASADSAVKSIDKVIEQIEELKKVLTFDANKTGINNQVQALETLDETAKIVSQSMKSVKDSIKGVSDSVSPQIQKLANTITRIATAGDKSEQAVKSLPKIGNALSKVTADMAGTKNIDSSINRFTSSIARLASAGDKSAVVAKELPKVGNALKDVADKMASVEGISDSTNSFTQAIAQLASAGDKAEKTASGLDQLADGTLRFFNAMKGAPQISENTIRMTQAMAQLSSTGGRVSASMKLTNTAFQTVSKSLNSLSNVAKKASDTIKKAMSGIAKVVSGAFSKIGQIGIKASNAMKRVAGDMAAAFARITHSSRGLNTASSNLKSLLKTILGFKGLQALGRFGKNALELGSDITEVENVVDTAFGSMAGHAYAFASTAKEQFGLSELAAKQYSGTMMAMLKSSGVAQKQAAIMSTTLAGLAGDIASFYNIETDEAFYKLRSAISGETEPMKQLGVNMNIVNLEAFAMSKGITKAYKDMTLAEQATLRYEYILAKTTDAQGDFAKTVGTYANQLRLLKLNIQSISAVIGQGLIAAILPAIKWLNALMSKLMDVAKAFRNFMYTITGFQPDKSGGGIVDDMAGIGDAADDLGDLGDAAEDAGKKIKKNLLLLPFDELNVLSEASSDIADDLEGIGDIDTGLGDIGDLDKFDDSAVNEWAKKLRDAFLNQDWEGLGRTIAELINKGLEWLYKKIKQITPKVEQALKNLAKVVNSVIANMNWDLLGRTIGATINLITKSFNALFGDDGFNLELLGQKLSVGLRGLLREADFIELGNALGNYFMIAWRIAQGFIEDMWRVDIDPKTMLPLTGWAELGNAIGDILVGVFDKINFETIAEVLTEGFKGALETITYALNRFSENLDWIVGKINLGLDRLYAGLKWDSTAGQDMGQKITALTDAISTAFNKLLDLDFGRVGQIIGAGITDIIRAFNQLTDIDTGGMDFEKLGKKLSDGLRKLVTEIPWEEFGNALGNGFMLSWRILDGFFNDMAKKSGVGLTGWQELGNGIADAINGLFDKFDLSKIASTISRVVNGIFETLKQAVENIRWDDIADNISGGLNTLISGIEWKENGKAFNQLMEKLLGMLLKAAQDTDWEGLGRGIGEFLSQIDWGKHFKTAIDTILEVLGGLFDGFGQTSAGKMAKAMAAGFAAFKVADAFSPLIELVLNFLGIEGPLAGAIAKGISALIGGLVATLVGGQEFIDAAFEMLNGFLDNVLNAVKDVDWGQVWKHIVDALGAVLSNLPEVLGKLAALAIEIVGNLIAGMIEWVVSGEAIADLAKFALNLIEGIVKGIMSVIGALFDVAKAIFDALVNGLKSLFGIHSPSTVMAEIGVNIMEGLINGIQSLFEAVVGLVKSVVDAVLGAWQGIKEKTEQVWNAVRDAVVAIWSGIRDKATEIFNGISDFLKGVFESIKESWSAVWQFLSEFLSNTWNFITETARNVFGGIGEFLEKIFDTLSEIWQSVWGFLSEFLSGIWTTITESAHSIFEGIGEFLSGLFDTVASIWESVWTTIHEVVTGIWNKIKEVATSVFNGIKETVIKAWTNIKEKTDELWGAVKKFIGEAVDAIKGWIVEKFGYAADFIKNAWETVSTKTKEVWEGLQKFLFEFIPNMIEKIVGFFAELPGKMFEIAKNVVMGFINGIADFAEKAYEKVKEFAGGIVGWVKDTLGIHSPSKVFEEIGGNTVQGYINGFDHNSNKVIDSAKRVAESSIRAFDGTEKEFNYIGSNMVGSLDAGIVSEMQGIKDAMMALVDNIRASFMDLNTNFQEIGSNLMHGLMNGVNNMMGSVQDVMSNVANSITGRFRDALGIHSPSTVFAELGNYSMQGYVKGMHDGDGLIRSAACGIADEARSALEKAGDFSEVGNSMINSLVSSLEKADISKVGGKISSKFADGIFIENMNTTLTTPESIINHSAESVLRHRMEYSGEINGRSSIIADGQFAGVIEEAAYRGFLRAQAETSPYLADIAENTRRTAEKEPPQLVLEGRETVEWLREWDDRSGYNMRI